jgi:hypothetical protein
MLKALASFDYKIRCRSSIEYKFDYAFIFLPSEVGDHVSCLVVARRQQFLA